VAPKSISQFLRPTPFRIILAILIYTLLGYLYIYVTSTCQAFEVRGPNFNGWIFPCGNYSHLLKTIATKMWQLRWIVRIIQFVSAYILSCVITWFSSRN